MGETSEASSSLPHWGSVIDPAGTTWGRSPAYNNSADPPTVLGKAVFGDSNVLDGTGGVKAEFRSQWAFTTTINPYQNDSIYESTSVLSQFTGASSSAGAVETPWGPYASNTPTALKTAFRADIKRDPTSTDPNSLLYLTTATVDGVFGLAIMNSSNGIHGPWQTNLVYGWKPNGHKGENGGTLDQWDCDAKDPSFVIHENGTSVIAYRGVRCDADAAHDHTERVGLLVSVFDASVHNVGNPAWLGPYQRIGVPIFVDAEDLFMWIDPRTYATETCRCFTLTFPGVQVGRGVAPATDHGVNHKKIRGAHAYSADGVHSWTKAAWELWPAELEWDDGYGPTTLLRQQRPSLQFKPLNLAVADNEYPYFYPGAASLGSSSAGGGGGGGTGTTLRHNFGVDYAKPLSLATGVDHLYDPCCDWYIFGSAWTAIQPLVQDCSAGQYFDPNTNACEVCSATDSKYQNRCLSTTTKYGKCVCGLCSDDYAGDHCERESIACYAMVGNKQCNLTAELGDSSTEQEAYLTEFKHLSDYSPSACSEKCGEFASSINAKAGCCYNWAPGSACKFYATVTENLMDAAGGAQQASLCLPRSQTTTTTMYPYNCTIGSGVATVSPTGFSQNQLHCADDSAKVTLTNTIGNLDVSASNDCINACEAEAYKLQQHDGNYENGVDLPLGGCCYAFQGASKTCYEGIPDGLTAGGSGGDGSSTVLAPAADGVLGGSVTLELGSSPEFVSQCGTTEKINSGNAVCSDFRAVLQASLCESTKKVVALQSCDQVVLLQLTVVNGTPRILLAVFAQREDESDPSQRSNLWSSTSRVFEESAAVELEHRDKLLTPPTRQLSAAASGNVTISTASSLEITAAYQIQQLTAADVTALTTTPAATMATAFSTAFQTTLTSGNFSSSSGLLFANLTVLSVATEAFTVITAPSQSGNATTNTTAPEGASGASGADSSSDDSDSTVVIVVLVACLIAATTGAAYYFYHGGAGASACKSKSGAEGEAGAPDKMMRDGVELEHVGLKKETTDTPPDDDLYSAVSGTGKDGGTTTSGPAAARLHVPNQGRPMGNLKPRPSPRLPHEGQGENGRPRRSPRLPHSPRLPS
eukprot:g13933.t1